MNYHTFRNTMEQYACFNTKQLDLLFPNYHNNLSRWTSQNLLIKLRQNYYAFPNTNINNDIQYLISNTIYQPSYISTHTALAFWGIIPEAIINITAVSTLKTATFKNKFGNFTYQKIKPNLFFGYKLMALGKNNIQIATPEKAILDLLYLYPFYNTVLELEELRFDDYFMAYELDIEKLFQYLQQFNNKSLDKRINLLLDVYDRI